MTDGRLSPSWRLASVRDGFTLTAVGDLVVDDALAPLLETRSPGLLELLRSADVTFGNFESTAVDLTDFDGWPEAESGGSWLISTSRVPADLRRIGFDLMARANNHTTDWGVAGMRSTDRLLTEAGIVHAGTGDTLADARAPRFLTTPPAASPWSPSLPASSRCPGPPTPSAGSPAAPVSTPCGPPAMCSSRPSVYANSP